MNERFDSSSLINPHLYFAYGSNLDPEQMDWRCPDAIALGAARLNDWAWRIGGRGYATVSPSPGHHVWGAIWNVSDSDLASLDRYEGVAGGLYRREFVTVMAENQPVDVLLYIERATTTTECPVPTTSSASSPGPVGSTFPRPGSPISRPAKRPKPHRLV